MERHDLLPHVGRDHRVVSAGLCVPDQRLPIPTRRSHHKRDPIATVKLCIIVHGHWQCVVDDDQVRVLALDRVQGVLSLLGADTFHGHAAHPDVPHGNPCGLSAEGVGNELDVLVPLYHRLCGRVAHFPRAAVHQNVNRVVTSGAADDAARGSGLRGPSRVHGDGRGDGR